MNTLTNEEKKLIDEMIAKIFHYAVSESVFSGYVARIKKGDDVARAEFEYILTGCNFHKEAELVKEGKIEEAYAAYCAA